MSLRDVASSPTNKKTTAASGQSTTLYALLDVLTLLHLAMSVFRPHRMRGVQRSGLLLFERGLCVCMHVCLLDVTMTCAKAVELIEMLFVAWTVSVQSQDGGRLATLRA